MAGMPYGTWLATPSKIVARTSRDLLSCYVELFAELFVSCLNGKYSA